MSAAGAEHTPIKPIPMIVVSQASDVLTIDLATLRDAIADSIGARTELHVSKAAELVRIRMNGNRPARQELLDFIEACIQEVVHDEAVRRRPLLGD